MTRLSYIPKNETRFTLFYKKNELRFWLFVFVGMFILSAIVSVALYIQRSALLDTGVVTTGTIEKIEQRLETTGNTKVGSRLIDYAIVHYTDETGTAYTVDVPAQSKDVAGSSVTVYYDQGNPSNAIVAENTSRPYIGFFTLTAVLGALLAIVGITAIARFFGARNEYRKATK